MRRLARSEAEGGEYRDEPEKEGMMLRSPFFPAHSRRFSLRSIGVEFKRFARAGLRRRRRLTLCATRQLSRTCWREVGSRN